VLFAVTVFNGADVVPACLRSAAAMEPVETDVDVLVLDDASPQPGFSGDVCALCAQLGIAYYRSPRNLGIPRNVNLGLLRAVEAGYDYVVIANSDVLFCEQLTDVLVRAASTDDAIGSVTAWSNNVSIYSLPNDDPDQFLGDQDRVNWVAATIGGHFGSATVDIPAGISFCVLIPTRVLRDVGLMDPVFGRGYCEETDWSLRSQSLGYRVTLSPSSFVYHRGQGSTAEAGLLPAGHSTVPENEKIVDLRYPLFRSQVAAFVHSDLLSTLHDGARQKIMFEAARQFGYTVEIGISAADPATRGPVVTLGAVDGKLTAMAGFIGFNLVLPVDDHPVGALRSFFERDPDRIRVVSPDAALREVPAAFAAAGTEVVREVGYPARV
jgi:GT2 family glycosyltransferase